MVRFHTLAIALGIEKIFWYNYQDGWVDRSDSEAHFGMRTHDGFLTPSYASMITMQVCFIYYIFIYQNIN